ncbi:GNAT family N-acetyltransferase [Spirosoma daeguense]
MDVQRLALVRQNFIAKAVYFAQLIPGMTAVETAEYAFVDTGLPTSTFNVAIPKTGQSEFLLPLFERINTFTRNSFPVALWCFSDALAELVQQHKLIGEERNVAMWADLTNVAPADTSLPDFHIRYVKTPDDYAHFADVLADLFGNLPEATQIRTYHQLISHAHKPEQPIRLYIGECAGQIVSTGTLFVDGDVAGIYDIATRPTSRGKGFGSVMFGYLLREANRLNARQVVLQASPDGLRIYQRAGFLDVGLVHVFENGV